MTDAVFLMPVLNPDPRELAATLASVEAQTYRCDIVIVDDGSRVPVEQTIGKRARCIVLRLPSNRGIAVALNTGLSYILQRDYRYVARIDCGDLSDVQRVASQKAFLDAHRSFDLVGALARVVDVNGKPLFVEGIAGQGRLLRKKLYDNPCFKHPTFFMRTASLRKFGLYSTNFPHAEDYELLCRLDRHGRIACLAQTLVTYERNPNGISLSRRSAQLMSRMKVQLRYFNSVSAFAYAGLARTALTLLVPQTMWSHASRLYWQRKSV